MEYPLGLEISTHAETGRLHAWQRVKIIEIGEEDHNIHQWPSLLGAIVKVDNYGMTQRNDGYLSGGVCPEGRDKYIFEYFKQIKVIPLDDENIILSYD